MVRKNKEEPLKRDSKDRIRHPKDGRIFKYGSGGVWMLRKKFPGIDGREHSLDTKSPTRAISAARVLEKSLTKKSLYRSPKGSAALRVQTFVEVVRMRFAGMESLSPNTQAKVRHLHENHLVPRFGSLKIESITEEDVRAYVVGKQQEGYRINPHVTELKTIFNMSWRMGLVDRPLELKLKDPPYELRRYFTKTQRAKLLRAVRKNSQTRQARADTCLQFMMGYRMGMRSGEVLGFRREFINLDTGVVHLPGWFLKTKATTDRMFPCNKVVLRHLRSRARKGAFTRFLFPSPADPLKPVRSHKTAVRNAFKTAGLEGRFHDLRRTFITDTQRAGKSLGLVTKLVGASPDVLLRHYTILQSSDAEQIMNMRVEDETE